MSELHCYEADMAILLNLVNSSSECHVHVSALAEVAAGCLCRILLNSVDMLSLCFSIFFK